MLKKVYKRRGHNFYLGICTEGPLHFQGRTQPYVRFKTIRSLKWESIPYPGVLGKLMGSTGNYSLSWFPFKLNKPTENRNYWVCVSILCHSPNTGPFETQCSTQFMILQWEFVIPNTEEWMPHYSFSSSSPRINAQI